MTNSINKNQPEDNREDIAGAAAVQRIKDVVDKTETCFFCTAVTTGGSGAARPMSVQQVDDRGHLWFLAASDSHTIAELGEQPDVRLFFQGSEHAAFLVLTGQARVSRDQAKIHELWEPIVKTWFTEGETDPRIRVVEVAPQGGYYWDNKHGSMVAGIKMLVGAAIGKTLDDSIEGSLAFPAKG